MLLGLVQNHSQVKQRGSCFLPLWRKPMLKGDTKLAETNQAIERFLIHSMLPQQSQRVTEYLRISSPNKDIVHVCG